MAILFDKTSSLLNMNEAVFETIFKTEKWFRWEHGLRVDFQDENHDKLDNY